MGKLRRLRDRIQNLLDRLMDFGDRLHQQAREETDTFNATKLREDAELVHEARKELWERTKGDEMKDSSTWATGRANAASASVHEGNIKLVPWLVLTAMLSGFSLAVGIFVMVQFAQMENNQARMAVHLMSNDALLLREGIIQPGDQWHGPEGNLEYGRKDQPQQRK